MVDGRTAARLGESTSRTCLPHLAAWSYRATESMSSIRPARPDVVWRVLGDSFRELRGRGRG